MARKVLLAPVYLYERRTLRSVYSCGPDYVYLLTSKGAYKEPTKKTASKLEKKIVEEIFFSDMKKAEEHVSKIEVDFTNIQEIYREYTKIIHQERSKDPKCEITVDVTGASKEAMMATTLLASLYNLSVSFVPSQNKKSDDYVKDRLKAVGDVESADPGMECITEKIKRWGKIDEDERLALELLYKKENKRYNSFTDLISEIGKIKGMTIKDTTFKRYWIRKLHGLADKGLVETIDTSEKSKGIDLSLAGIGIYEGIKDVGKDGKIKHAIAV